MDAGFLFLDRPEVSWEALLDALREVGPPDRSELFATLRCGVRLIDVEGREEPAVGTYIAFWGRDPESLSITALAERLSRALACRSIACFIADPSCTGGFALFGPDGCVCGLRVDGDSDEPHVDPPLLAMEQLFDRPILALDGLFFAENVMAAGEREGDSTRKVASRGRVLEAPQDLRADEHPSQELRSIRAFRLPDRAPAPRPVRGPVRRPKTTRRVPLAVAAEYALKIEGDADSRCRELEEGLRRECSGIFLDVQTSVVSRQLASKYEVLPDRVFRVKPGTTSAETWARVDRAMEKLVRLCNDLRVLSVERLLPMG